MPKQPATVPLALPPRAAGAPVSGWLYGALRGEILAGRLRSGARLPATRDLAAQYGLSRGSVVRAFEQLAAEGYLVSRVGSGTHVNRVLPARQLVLTRRPGPPGAPARRPPRLSAVARRLRPFDNHQDPSARAFRTNQPALDLVPTTLWSRLVGRQSRRASTAVLLGCPPMGYRPLRAAVADYLVTSRGVRCSTEQVVMVSGVSEALDVAARLLIDPGDRVGIEDPGYDGAALAFAAAGARLVPVPIDREGAMLGPHLAQLRLLYLTPAHQCPLGISMTLPRRLAVLDWARAARALVFEDDYDSEFRYAGRPLPALQGLDRHEVVLFSGSFSKVLFPSLRVGYLVVPPALVDRVEALRSVTVRHPPMLDQAVLAEFLAEGHFGRHVRRMREVYAERLGVLLESAREHLDGLLDISTIEAGLQTVGWLRQGVSVDAVIRAALHRQVEVGSLTRFRRARPMRAGIRLGFAAVDPPELRRGVRELAAVLGSLRPHR